MTTNEVKCPKCGNDTWDNRVGKKNPKSPDYKCKDKACDGAIWPPRNCAPVPAQAKQAFSSGPLVPGIDGPYQETGAPPAEPVVFGAKLNGLFTLYGVCMDEVLSAQVPKLNKADVGTTPEAIAAMCATLFIAASKA